VFGAGACAEEPGRLSGSGSAVGDGDGDGSMAPREPVAATVTLQPTTFEPDEVSVKVGDKVLWKWVGGVQHNVNGGDEFKSELQADGEFAHTFDTAGTFEYVCDVHPTTMKGTVEVAAA
jgi:plastocyanin